MTLRRDGRVSEKKRCGLAQSVPDAIIRTQKLNPPVTNKTLVCRQLRIAALWAHNALGYNERDPPLDESLLGDNTKGMVIDTYIMPTTA